MEKLYFEELEEQEEFFWEYVVAGGAGVVCGVVTYVAIAAAT